MLEARFERIVGDIGNPDTLRYPVMHRVVPGATVSRVVCDQDDDLVDLFAAHADQLVKAGVTAITTSCGFMARHQSKLEKRVKLPFAASALCLLSDTRRRYGKVGVITADSSQLGEDHFTACGSAPPVAVAGMQDYPAFRSAILRQTAALQPQLIEAEAIAAAVLLCERHPKLNALLLECTNLPPYRRAIERATGLPVIDALSLCDGLMSQSGAPELVDPPGM